MMLPLAAVRHRWTAFAGTFVTLALGVALITGTLLVYLSAVPAVPERYAGAAVYVRNEGVPWSPEAVRDLTERLGAVPGVAGVVPERSFYAQLVPDGRPVGRPDVRDPQGHGWSAAALAPYPVRTGRAPATDGEVVVPHALGTAAGTPVVLLTAAGPARYTVTGTVDGPGLFVADAVAERLAGGVRLIGVRTAPGADPDAVGAAVREAVRAAVGGSGRVLAGAVRGLLEERSAGSTRQIGAQVLATMVAVAVFSSVFVVASTCAFAANQRRREFGLLRAVGATPGQIRRSVLREALAVGVAGGVVGVLVGCAAAPVLGGVLVDAGFEPPGFTVRSTPWPPAAAFLVGLLVAVAGAASASRRAGAVGPMEALREASVDRRPMTPARWAFGGLSGALGVLLTVATAAADGEDLITTSMLAAMALIVALALLAPVVVPAVLRAVTRPLERLSGATGVLARESALNAARRTASVAAPVIATVGFGTLILGQVATVTDAYGSRGTDAVRHEVVVRPDGTPGLCDAALDALPAGHTLAWTPTTVFVGGTEQLAAGVTPSGFRTAVPAGAAVEFGAPGTVVVGRPPAGSGVPGSAPGGDGSAGGPADGGPGGTGGAPRVGDTVQVTFADGRTAGQRVVAVVDTADLPALILPRATVREHDPAALTELAYVDGVPPADLRAALAGLGATAVAGTEYRSDAAARDDALVRTFVLILVGMSVGYTGLAIANTLVMATAGRRRDFAVLRLSGGTTGQVLRVVGVEAALVVGVGAALGLLVALGALAGVSAGVSASLGRAVPLLLPWGTVLGLVAACLGLAVAAALLTARPGLREAASGARG
ncbi:FtsX-like permease family protein [Kitasatospora sp. NPDC088346]|uniref:FtsX-like permease family protein n=1 Tax=Kitasatospora sp. NPDC088346 TaxID=3364073 RepID=UPI003802DC35